MSKHRRVNLVVLVLSWSVIVHAQVAHAQDADTPVAAETTVSDTPSAADADTIPPPPPPPPPSGLTAGPSDATAPMPPPPAPPPGDRAARKVFDAWLGLGIGNAAGCGNEDPDSPCAVDGAGALSLGGVYRFDPNFGLGLELGAWSFTVSDAWRGQLMGMPTDASIDAAYLALIARWYWFSDGVADPYLQFGVGPGSITATVSDEDDRYTYFAGGLVYQLGIGVDWHLADWFKLGPQLLAGLLLGNRVCEEIRGTEVCRDPEKNDKGEQEGNALAYRLMVMATFMFHDR